MTDDEIVADMLPAMEKFLPGITENLAFAHIDRWDPGVVQSYSGWYKQVARLAERISDTDRVQLAGDFMSAASTNACALSGELAASRLARAVSAPSATTGSRIPAEPAVGAPATSNRHDLIRAWRIPGRRPPLHAALQLALAGLPIVASSA